MRLPTLATIVTQRINTSIIAKVIGLDTSCIVVTNLWLEWTAFLLCNVISHIQSCQTLVITWAKLVKLFEYQDP